MKISKKEFFVFFVFLFLSVSIPLTSGYNSVANIILTIALLYTSRFNKTTIYLLTMMLFFIILYIPFGYSLGRIDASYIVSLLQTNRHEATEFISEINAVPIAITILSLLSLVVYFTFGFVAVNAKRKRFVFFLIFIAMSLNSYPIRYIKTVIKDTTAAIKDINEIKRNASTPDDFIITENKGKYDNIIVVIGESVTKDYLSVYGYPHKTTPWLNTAPGTFFSNYISTAPNTYMSLPRTLSTYDEKNPMVNNNIVSLSNKAGFDTWWISNQGFVGVFDTPITSCAINAKNKIFMKKGDYESNNGSDMILLDSLSSILSESHSSRNVIFIHMMGSHPVTCDRVVDFPINFSISEKDEVNCYLASIEKLDFFIKKIVSDLNKTKKSYVLFYFSDHGLTVDESDRPVRHGSEHKQNYNIPFFIIKSDDKTHNINNTEMSARCFIPIFESVIGISSNIIEPKSPGEINDSNIKVFNGSYLVDYSSLKEKVILK